jgi:hypothetical protein
VFPRIPDEASFANWLIDCVQKYFEALGYKFYSEIQSQKLEKDYPFDIYASIQKGNKVKRFGFQVKRPYLNKRMYWRLKEKQHINMRKFPWIIYALPDFTEREYHKLACYHMMFKYPGFSYKQRLYYDEVFPYERFGSIAKKIVNCIFGEKIIKDRWIDSRTILLEYQFINQIHTYLDFTEMIGQVISYIMEEKEE